MINIGGMKPMSLLSKKWPLLLLIILGLSLVFTIDRNKDIFGVIPPPPPVKYSSNFTKFDPVTAFDEPSSWTNNQGDFALINKNIKQNGTGSILLDTGKFGNSAVIKRVMKKPFIVPKNDLVKLWVYAPEIAKDHEIKVELGQGGFNRSATGYLIGLTENGWWCMLKKRSDFILDKGFDWNKPIDRIRISLEGRNITRPNIQAYIDSLFIGAKDKTNIIMTFDDGFKSDYLDAFAYMQPRGMLGTSFVAAIDIGNTAYLNHNQMDKMYEKGWDFGNHTYGHSNLSSLSPEDRLSEIIKGSPNGYSRSKDYLALPFGEFKNTTPELIKANVKAARITEIYPIETATGRINPYCYPTTVTLIPSTSLAKAKSDIDEAVLYGYSAIIVGHELVEENPTGYQWSRQDFFSLIDHIKHLRDNGKLEVKTMREFHEGLEQVGQDGLARAH